MIGRSGLIAATFGISGLLVLAGILFGACQSEPSGPAGCAAAGGRCVIGGFSCAKVGPQDCNPDRNPGGAVCCLEEAVVDAGVGQIADVVDSSAFCAAPLRANAHPATLDDVPFASWCASNPGRVIEWKCGERVAVTIGIGVDCDEQYWFDSTSRKLLAILQGCNADGMCVEGNADFSRTKDCLSGDVVVSDFVDICADGGLTTMDPDGAGAACRDDSQCPAGYRCGYFTNSGCGGVAQCFYGDFQNNPTCEHQMRCACDGTPTEGCVGPWGGFTLKPVSTRVSGPCTE